MLWGQERTCFVSFAKPVSYQAALFSARIGVYSGSVTFGRLRAWALLWHELGGCAVLRGQRRLPVLGIGSPFRSASRSDSRP